jgi:hypothetical protein
LAQSDELNAEDVHSHSLNGNYGGGRNAAETRDQLWLT